MLRSIATVSLSGTLPEKLAASAAARFDAVEIFESDLLYFDGSPQDVRRLAADLGLDIALYQPFREFEGAPRDRQQRNLDRAERKFDLMEGLGTPLMLLCRKIFHCRIPTAKPCFIGLLKKTCVGNSRPKKSSFTTKITSWRESLYCRM